MERMFMSSKDLLYAHGCLCDYVKRANRTCELNIEDAQRLCDVVNNFQEYLKLHLTPGTPKFHVAPGMGSYIEPIGGWYGQTSR
jgi:hypothetical protein